MSMTTSAEDTGRGTNAKIDYVHIFLVISQYPTKSKGGDV